MKLSKSDYLLFLKCPHELWLKKNEPDLADSDLTESEKFLIEQGYNIQRLAFEYLNKSIDTLHSERRVEVQELLAIADIFHESEGGNSIYEVKSTTSIKEEHLYDLAFQKLVFDKFGISIRRLYLVYVNNKYIKNGDLNASQFLLIDDVTERVLALMKEVEVKTFEALNFIKSPRPDISKLYVCDDALSCPFILRYYSDLPAYSIFDITRLSREKKIDLIGKEIIDIVLVPEDYPLSVKQIEQVRLAQLGKAEIKKDLILSRLKSLKYPIYFIDYETFNPAIPMYDDTHPYQQLVFQYSLHILEDSNSDPIHRYYISTKQENPMFGLLQSLEVDLTDFDGSMVVWNKTFEMTRNNEMASKYPQFKDLLLKINDSIFDLMSIFSDGLYIDPAFKGSTSIKNILPVIVPELNYDVLDIKNGSIASVMWYRMMNEQNAELKAKIFDNLNEYCKLDTLAMVKIFQKLIEE